jgi:hypothetical protein
VNAVSFEGVIMPEIIQPLSGAGGYITGTFRNPDVLPTRSSASHTLMLFILPRSISGRCGLACGVSLKSKMPCLPGLTPVSMDDQAGGVVGGTVLSRVPHAPSFMILANDGSFFSSTMGRIHLYVAPSSPTTMTLGAVAMILPAGNYK